MRLLCLSKIVRGVDGISAGLIGLTPDVGLNCFWISCGEDQLKEALAISAFAGIASPSFSFYPQQKGSF